MLLLISEHKSEIEPLLNLYPFEKHSNLFIFNNISVFINYGKKALSLGYRVTNILSENKDIKIVLLFGFSGIVNSNLNLGDMFIADRLKLMHNKKPLFNPIDMPYIEGFKNVEAITLLDKYETDNEFLSLFADSVDKESYFFAKAVKSIDRFGIVLRVASDKNTKEAINEIKGAGFKYDIKPLKDFVEKLSKIDKDEALFEIFKYTGISDMKILSGLKRLIDMKRMTFSMRQKLYKKIIINKKREHEETDYAAVFIEQGIDKNRIKLNIKGRRVFEIDDYVGYFHNLKNRKAIIFASKRGEFLRKTPDNYTPDKSFGYSILNAYNCIYNCAYCFLKGYFKSFNPVVFLNYEDFFEQIKRVVKKDKKRPLYFYSGTFSDSLAMGIFYDFNEKLAEFFGEHFEEDIILEMRTKSNNIKNLLKIKPYKNVVVAFSLNPQAVIDKYEHLTPSLKERIEAVKILDEFGYNIGLRIDPVLADRIEEYGELFGQIGNIKHLHSVEIGFLRYDKKDYAALIKKHHYVLKGLVYEDGMYRYPKALRDKAYSFFKGLAGPFYLSME